MPLCRLFVDTSVFLRLYGKADDPKLLDNLRGVTPNLVTTDQVLREFGRNRASLLRQTIKQFSEDNGVESTDPPIVRHAPSFGDFNIARERMKSANKAVVGELQAMLDDSKPDPLALAFDSLWKSADHRPIALSPDHIRRAKERKLLGNPPTSPDKYTIGDEVNWECLLELTDDLIVVTRDYGFLNYQRVLRDEYHERTGRQLRLVGDKLSEALKLLNQAPSESLIEIEKQVERLPRRRSGPIRVPMSGSMLQRDELGNSVVAPHFSQTASRELESDHMCFRCLSNGPWHGNRCMTCGTMGELD